MPVRNRRYSVLRKWLIREIADYADKQPDDISLFDPMSDYIGGGIVAVRAFVVDLKNKPGFRDDGFSAEGWKVPSDATVLDVLDVIKAEYEDPNFAVNVN